MQPFVSALGTELGLTSKEIADIIWLALQMQAFDEDAETTKQLETPATTSTNSDRVLSSPANSTLLDAPDEQLEDGARTPFAEVHQPSSSTQLGLGNQLMLKVPDARSLREPLSLARSLKPLLQKVVAGWSTVLDEAATVERIVDEQTWLPVLKPALEPWLDLVLVVDESVSMQIWQRTISELQRLLSHYGVFRDVRVWGMTADARGKITLRPGIGVTTRRQATRQPSELIDPSRRRLILIATDCVSPSWQNGSLLPALKLWATNGPMAIVQMLPEWLWSRTGLGFASSVKLQSLLPGVPNQQLIASDISPWDEIDLETGVKVPVVTLEPEPFSAWTKMVTGKGDAWSPGFVLEEVVFPKEQIVQRLNTAVDGSAEQRVQRFRVTASPTARQLAGLLAAAPVISFPVVRIIQDRLLPESRQVHVAEVFLGGLLQPIGEIDLATNSDITQYDFLDGVREALLKSVPTSDSVNVLEEVSKFVAERLGLSLNVFAAVLKNPKQTEDKDLTRQSRPFAIVTARILRHMGGEYAQFAEEIEQQYAELLQTPSNARKDNPYETEKSSSFFDPLQLRLEAIQAECSVLLEKLSELRYTLGYTAGTSEKFQLEKEIEKLESKLEELEQQSRSLEQTSMDGRLYQALLKLGYLKQERLFKKFVQRYSIAAFLIYGKIDFGQQWLLNRLVVQHTRDSITGKVVRVNLSRVARRNDVAALWRESGRQIGLGRREGEIPAIIERVFQWWRTQNVLLIFYDVDVLPETFLKKFMEDFWTPLATQALEARRSENPFKLVMLLVDNTGCVGDWSIQFAETLEPNWQPKTPVKLPVLSKFTKLELANWLTYASSDLPLELVDLDRLDEIVEDIFEKSDAGVPELTFEEICNYAGSDFSKLQRFMKV